jgi:hypothetical protein
VARMQLIPLSGMWEDLEWNGWMDYAVLESKYKYMPVPRLCLIRTGVSLAETTNGPTHPHTHICTSSDLPSGYMYCTVLYCTCMYMYMYVRTVLKYLSVLS